MKQSGAALIEALLAAALLGLGLLGASRLTAHALTAALQTRQAVQAQALAAEALDCAIARTGPCIAEPQIQRQGMTYTLHMQETPLDATLTEVRVQVQWGPPSAQRSLDWRTRVSAMPDWLGLSLP